MKYILYILIVFSFIPHSAISQDSKIDSLRYVTAINRGNPLSNENIDFISKFLQRRNKLDVGIKMRIAKGYFDERTTKIDTTNSNKRIYIWKRDSTFLPLNGFYAKYITLLKNVIKKFSRSADLPSNSEFDPEGQS